MVENNCGLPLIGDKFPSITVKTTYGPKNLPDDMKCKWFVLFSHLADYTPVCTTEFVAFAKRNDQSNCYDWWFCYKELGN